METKNIDFGAAFNFAIEQFKAKPKDYIIFTLAVILASIILALPLMLLGMGAHFVAAKTHVFISFLFMPVQWVLSWAVSGIVFGALIPPLFSFIAKAVKGETANFMDEIKNQSRFKDAFLAAFLAHACMFIGFLLCIIPGILISPILPISLYLVWKGDSGFGAIQKAFNSLFVNPIGALFILVLTFIGGLGVILCFVGILITLPASYIAIWHVCKQIFSELDEAPADAPAAPQQ